MKPLFVLTTPLIVGLSLLGACSKGGEQGGDAGAENARRIAVIPKGTTHEFWKSIHAGANKAAAEFGVEVIWKGPQREDDRDDQIKVVEDFISRGVDGIVCAPLDDKALVRPLADATNEGIPVVVTDSGVDWGGYVSFVATDNEKGGRLAAKRLGELLEGKGTALMMRYQEGSASTMNRESGFMEVMKSDFPGIEIVSANQYGGATTESAYATAENLLVSFKEVGAIFCPNESTTFGMLRALQDAGRAGEVTFVGFDASEKLVRALEAKELHGLVLQNPMAMGYEGVKAIVDHLDGKPVEKRLDTGASMVTPDNMNEDWARALHSPDLSEWLN